MACYFARMYVKIPSGEIIQITLRRFDINSTSHERFVFLLFYYFQDSFPVSVTFIRCIRTNYMYSSKHFTALAVWLATKSLTMRRVVHALALAFLTLRTNLSPCPRISAPRTIPPEGLSFLLLRRVCGTSFCSRSVFSRRLCVASSFATTVAARNKEAHTRAPWNIGEKRFAAANASHN